MKSFDDLKENWQNQELLEKPELNVVSINSKLSNLKRKQEITPIVLGVTAVVLLIFLFTRSEAAQKALSTGILLMSGSLVIRILVELWSTRQLKKLDVTLNVNDFIDQILQFTNARKVIHFVVTPIVLLVYFIAFIALLPLFKANVSAGMYQYILWSSIIVFLAIVILKIINIRKELAILKKLKIDFSESE